MVRGGDEDGVVRGDDDGEPGGHRLAEDGHQPLGVCLILLRRRFVEEGEHRLSSEDASYGDALTFPAGKYPNRAVPDRCQA